MATVAVNNPPNVDVFSDLVVDSQRQSTAPTMLNSEAAFARKCFHPPTAVPGYIGLPTNDSRSQVCLEWRNLEMMTNPIVNNGSTNVTLGPADLTAFDYAILIGTGARINMIPYVYCSGGPGSSVGSGWYQDLANTQFQTLYNWTNWWKDANKYRPAYRSSTFYLNATAFNDTGMVACEQFNPALLWRGTVMDWLEQKPHSCYEFIKQKVAKMSKPLLTAPTEAQRSRWESIPIHHRTEILRRCGYSSIDTLNLDPNVSAQVLNLGSNGTNFLVPENSQILAQDIRSYSGRARDGCFTVNKMTSISPEWMTATNTAAPADFENGMYECYIYWTDSTGGPHFTDILEPVTTTVNVTHDTMWSNSMSWAWVRFTGLSLNSQVSTNTQLLIMKTITGIEVQPQMASAWMGMVTAGPPPDLAAFQSLMEAFYHSKDGYPAKFNFWGELAAVAGEILPKVAPKIGKFLMDMFGQATTRSKAKEVKKIEDVTRKVGSIVLDPAVQSGSLVVNRRKRRSRGIPLQQYLGNRALNTANVTAAPANLGRRARRARNRRVLKGLGAVGPASLLVNSPNKKTRAKIAAVSRGF